VIGTRQRSSDPLAAGDERPVTTEGDGSLREVVHAATAVHFALHAHTVIADSGCRKEAVGPGSSRK
jgi:hypothetical protein